MNALRTLSLILLLSLGVALAQEPAPADPPADPPAEAPAEPTKEDVIEKEAKEAAERLAAARDALAEAQTKAADAAADQALVASRVTAAEAAATEATAAVEAAKAALESAQTALEGADDATRATLTEKVTAAQTAYDATVAAQEAAQKEVADSQAASEAAAEAVESGQAAVEEAQAALERAESIGVASDAARRAAAEETGERNAEVNIEALKYRMTPLSLAELEAEAEAWRQVLQEEVTEISYTQVAMLKATGAEKTQLAEALTKLREERTALIDRFKVVLSALETKGGDASSHHVYHDAVSGVFSDIDATDVSATWTTVVGWAKSPEGGLRILKNLLFALGTLIVFKLIAGVLGRIVNRAMTSGRFNAPALLRAFFVNIARKSVFAVGIVMALSMLEVNIAPFIAALGGAVLVIGLALQGTLANFAAGILIILYRPFDVGDVVKVAGELGTVEAMNLSSTTILTPDNQQVIVPNGTVWGGVITNISGKPKRRVDMVFGVGYSDDLAKTEETLKAIIEKHPLVLQDPAPVVQVHELADSSVNFVVRPWCKTTDYWGVYWDITRAVKDTFDEAGISIPFPQHDVHMIPEPSA